MADELLSALLNWSRKLTQTLKPSVTIATFINTAFPTVQRFAASLLVRLLWIRAQLVSDYSRTRHINLPYPFHSLCAIPTIKWPTSSWYIRSNQLFWKFSSLPKRCTWLPNCCNPSVATSTFLSLLNLQQSI